VWEVENMHKPKLVLRLDPEVEEKLEKFGDEVRVRIVDSETFPWIDGSIIRQQTVSITFRDLYVEAFMTISLRKRNKKGEWLAQLISLRGSVGMIACVILYFSKFLGKKPSLIYMDRHLGTDITDITAEWYREDDVDMDWRMEVHKASGLKLEKTIEFEDVLEEARKFLDEWY
jgi:hypothetical protein